MGSPNTPVPENIWGGRPWLTGCCGGCCLVYTVGIIGLIFFFRYLIGMGGLPGLDEIQSFFMS